MPLCVRCQCLNQYDRHVHVTRLSKILVFQFASLSFLLAFSPPAVSKCFRRDSLRSYDRRLLSGVRAASYAQALQGLRTETCGCGTLRIGKACRLSLATRSSSAHLCDEPALCYICGSVIIHIFDQSEMRQRVLSSLPDRAAAHHQQHGASTGRGKAAHATTTVSKTRLPIQPITVYRMLYRCDYSSQVTSTHQVYRML